MNNTDNMLTFLDAWMLAERGEDLSKAIENQEKRGQAEVVRSQRLPRKLNNHTVPNDILFSGVTKEMDYEAKSKIMNMNLEAYTRVQYEKMGIVIISCYDDLFWNVILPAGWEIKATDHTMWNELRDDKNRKRITFFYKAAFYDRDAFSNLQTRFNLDVTHVADPSSDYDVWKESDYQGTIKDGDEVIYRTKCIHPSGSYQEDDKLKDELWKEIEAYMGENWPEYKNIHAYWDVERK